MKEGKARYFSLVSYLSTEQLEAVLERKGASIRAWAMIDHDKDEKEAHRHLVLRTITSWKPASILAWFKGYEQNTFVEVVHDRQAIIEYLTHENDPEKHHYDDSEIIDHGLSDMLPSGETDDDAMEIVQKMLEGVSVRELVRLYGRDFVYHYNAFALVVNQIREEEA